MTVQMLMLIEGAELCYIEKDYKGEYVASIGMSMNVLSDPLWTVAPQKTSEFYLFEVLDEIRKTYAEWKRGVYLPDYFIYFGYHVTDQPMSWEQCQGHLIAKTLGIPVRSDIYHRYSDMSGYLWTEASVQDDTGHNIQKELEEYAKCGKFLTMRFECSTKVK